MAMQTLNHPTGPRAGYNGTPKRLTNRGGIYKRGPQTRRVDKDGDLNMDAPMPKGRGRGIDNRRDVSPSHQAYNGRGVDNRRTVSTASYSGRGQNLRDTRTVRVDSNSVKNAIQQALRSNDNVPKGPRAASGTFKGHGKNGGVHAGAASKELDEIIVNGLKESKAASNPGGGLKDLLDFLERKAAPARIEKSRRQGDAIVISVHPEDVSRFTKINGFQFARATLRVEVYNKTLSQSEVSTCSETSNVAELLKNVLAQRYSQETKVLDLSNLGKEPQLVNIGMFGSNTTASKFFPALMKVCASVFTNEQEKADAVPSISLANNDLPNLDSVTTLAQTFPNLKNLDLSNNQFKSIQSLDRWRMKFRKLEHIVLAGNPIVENDPTFMAELMRWYPSLRVVNTTQIGSATSTPPAAEIANPLRLNNSPPAEMRNPLGGSNTPPAATQNPQNTTNPNTTPQNNILQQLGLPQDFGSPTDGKSEEQVMKERMAMELTERTKMTIQYSGMCLDESGWDLERAYQAFEGAKANLPQEAFIQF